MEAEFGENERESAGPEFFAGERGGSCVTNVMGEDANRERGGALHFGSIARTKFLSHNRVLTDQFSEGNVVS